MTGAAPPTDAIAEIESARVRDRQSVRAALGAAGATAQVSILEGFRLSGAGIYTVVALGLLVIVDQLLASALSIMAPDVSRSLGVSEGQLASMQTLSQIVLVFASLGIAAYVRRRAVRAAVAKLTALVWSLATVATAFVGNGAALFGARAVDAATSGSVGSIHVPLIMDTYIPAIRIRMVAMYSAFTLVAAIATPLFVALLTGPLFLSWRGAVLVMGVACLGATAFAVGLRDRGFGRFDTAVARATVMGSEASPRVEHGTDLSTAAVMRRVLLIPTFRKLLVAYAVFGMLLAPLNIYIVFFLQDRYGLDSAQRGLFFAVANAGGLIGVLGFGRLAERIFRANPSRLLRVSAVLQGVGTACLPLAVLSPAVVPCCLLFTFATAVYVSTTPALSTGVMNMIEPPMRAAASALIAIFTFAVGGPAGLILLGSTADRYGVIVAMSLLTIPGLISALFLRSASHTISQDLDAAANRIIEEEESKQLRARGAHLPLLGCRHIDFSYGHLQVLFDVDFTVDDGEMVALLGTNGAGKSTLLRVISGVGLPSGGSVRFRGEDITFLDATRRVNLGITQIPGGRAVFTSLDVTENLRVFGFTQGRSRAELSRGMDAAFAAFPRLAERRSQLAGTLSGGEQQMLGLAKALILRPRLLLIDELSLGLAPKIVSELLGIVRQINAAGTAVVLVEQSANLALSLVGHAYFMEKGEMRFDGKAAELLGRTDLLRSVFLEGATRVQGLVEGSPPVAMEPA